MPVHQHFSVPAGDDVELIFDIDLNDEITLVDASLVTFSIFEQQYGVVTDDEPVLTRHDSSGNGGITIPGSPPNRLFVLLEKDQTVDLLRNFYFELKVVDVNGNNSTVADGTITFIETHIPPVTIA